MHVACRRYVTETVGGHFSALEDLHKRMVGFSSFFTHQFFSCPCACPDVFIYRLSSTLHTVVMFIIIMRCAPLTVFHCAFQIKLPLLSPRLILWICTVLLLAFELIMIYFVDFFSGNDISSHFVVTPRYYL